MKQIYLLTTILFLSVINLTAQTVTIAGSCQSVIDGDYSLSADVNGRPSYIMGIYIIQWTGTRWEHNDDMSQVGMYNDSNSANPPATSFSAWTPVLCTPAGTFSGDGTSTETLGVTEVELSNKKIKLFPNPSNDFIQISGLSTIENYKIYNVIGTEIINGMTTNNKKINIRNINSGLYFLKFESGNTIKFLKE
jgi:hypothetical protein